MGRFNWAPEFMRLNGAMLDEYSRAKDSTAVVRIQNEYIQSVLSQGKQDEPVDDGTSGNETD